jgi:Xaa-Pro aminopeptidase
MSWRIGPKLIAVNSPAVSVAGRSDRLMAELSDHEVDALLVSSPVNVRYLTGYTGSNGLAVVGLGDGGMRRFFTDFRYAAQADEQVPEEFAREIASVDLLEVAARSLGEEPSAARRLGFDDGDLSVKRHARLRELLPPAWELVPCAGVVERLRAVKDGDELTRIRAAAELADGILEWVAERGLAGRTERMVALELEHEMRLRGAQAPSFSSIVASGPHGALPHAEPRDVAIPADVLVTIDLGAIIDGYCSDCTRTFATGELEAQAREVYEVVLDAQQAALDAVAPGRTGREVDAVAREVIDRAGYGEYFGHGLGHGVGMEIHEGPRLSRTAGDEPLRTGNVVTVEPGIYLPDRLGVRIEDLVLVTDGGAERLSHYPKHLQVVG